MFAASVLIDLSFVDGPSLSLTALTVLRVVCWLGAPDADNKSDLMNPSVLLCLTLDQPFDCCSKTSTLVFDANVLIIPEVVEEPALMLTAPVVLNVETAATALGAVLPPRVKKSDLMNPFVLPILTLDQPAGLCSVTSTLVPLGTVCKTFDVVDADALTLTPSVVRNVVALLPAETLRKSDLINPVAFPTCTLDQPFGLCSSTSTLVPTLTTLTTLASVDGSALMFTPAVTVNVPAAADAVVIDIPNILAMILTVNMKKINLRNLRFTILYLLNSYNLDACSY